jgi:hypothetical protein
MWTKAAGSSAYFNPEHFAVVGSLLLPATVFSLAAEAPGALELSYIDALLCAQIMVFYLSALKV